MSTEYLTIHVLAAGDLFTDVLNADTAINFVIPGDGNLPEKFRDLGGREGWTVVIHELTAV